MVDSISQLHQTQFARGNQAQAAPQAGRFAKTLVRKLTSPSQAIQDLQEELSSAHSEHTESKKIEEHHIEDFHDHHYVELVEQIEKAYSLKDDPQKKHLEEFLANLRRRDARSEEDIKELISQITEDKAEGFAILEAAQKQGGENITESMRALLETTARHWVAEEGAKIQAGANTISLARQTQQNINIEAAALQTTYQTLVSSYQSILPALTQMASSENIEKFEHLSDFLMRAAAKDLAATRPSVQPERLQHILAEFQGIKMFNTLHEWSGNIYDRFSDRLQNKTKLQKHDLFARALKFIETPESFNSQILLPIRGLDPSEKVLVLQGLRSGIRNLPGYLFARGDAEKSRILFPVQNEIDQLVFEQDA